MKGTLYVYHYDDKVDPTKVDIGIVQKKYAEETEAFWLNGMDSFITNTSFHRYYKVGPPVIGKWND